MSKFWRIDLRGKEGTLWRMMVGSAGEKRSEKKRIMNFKITLCPVSRRKKGWVG
jgi:hypothetical protein